MKLLSLISTFALGLTALLHGETAYWVWQRQTPLEPGEICELADQKVRLLFWQSGELTLEGETWKYSARYALPENSPELQIIPVVRMVTTSKNPFRGTAHESLVPAIRSVARRNIVQLDFDCPDRLLADYVEFLQVLRTAGLQVSITALAGWCDRPEWKALQQSVTEMEPMFYDLEPETQLAGSTSPKPLLDAKTVVAALRKWNSCSVPWRVGLPSFARITIFDAKGKSRGHLRAWDWDAVCFAKPLLNLAPTQRGVATLRAETNGALAEAALTSGDLVAVRWPDRAELQQVIDAMRQSTALGPIYFRWPEESGGSGWSPPQIADWRAVSALQLRPADAQHVELVNTGRGDLPPRLSGPAPRDRGYALEIEAGSALFREAEAGDFWRVGSHIVRDEKDELATPAAVPLATRLTFWFANLRAGEKRRTGLIQLAPGTDLHQLRYRILGLETAPVWQKLP